MPHRYCFDLWLMYGFQKRREEQALQWRLNAIRDGLSKLDTLAVQVADKQVKRFVQAIFENWLCSLLAFFLYVGRSSR